MNTIRLKKVSQIIFPLVFLGLGLFALETTANVSPAEPLSMIGQPLKNINATTKSASPTNLFAINDLLLFNATDTGKLYGGSIWRSNGTEAGTFKMPGRQLTGNPIAMNDTIFYPGKSSLYETDGSVDNTREIPGIWKDALSDSWVDGNLAILGNKIFYVRASDITVATFYELMSYDLISGTVAKISGNLYGFGDMKSVNDLLFFGNQVSPQSGNWELWASNGTPEHTYLVKDIYPGSGRSNPASFVDLNNILIFAATDPEHGRELWRSDGTEAGTVLLCDLLPGEESSNPNHLTKISYGIFFNTMDRTDENALWYSDGSSPGTRLVKSFYPGEATAIQLLTEVNEQLYFILVRGEENAHQYELWKSDSTEEGTSLIRNFGGAPISSMTAVSDELFFSINGGIWRSDGTTTGTSLVKQIDPLGMYNPTELTHLNGKFFFSAYDDFHGWELWFSDGTEPGTQIVKDIFDDTYSSEVTYITNVNNTIYMNADDGQVGQELWQSDGTEAGTTLLKDIFPGLESSNPTNLTNHQGTLLFTANDGTFGRELWKSDGTETGTQIVRDIHPTGDSSPEQIASSVTFFYFTADDGVNGRELWQSTGTENDTTLVKDINPAGSSTPKDLVMMGSTVYFTADDGINGRELWRSDGTASGTNLIKDISPPDSPNYPKNLTAVGSSIFFSLWVTDTVDAPVTQLWRSDGTEAETTIVQTFANTSAFHFVAGNDILFFMLTHDDIVELWRSDGKPSGTWPLIISDPITINAYWNYEFFGSAGLFDPQTNIFYFTFNDGHSGVELFQTDGTLEGTGLVKDINPYSRPDPYPGPIGSWPSHLTIMDAYDHLFFLASDGDGEKIWLSDGTTIGTRSITLIDGASDPTELTAFQDTLVFSAETEESDREPWILKVLNYLQFFPRALSVE